jgi:hypothetical protein
MLKVCLFALLCWDVGRYGNGTVAGPGDWDGGSGGGLLRRLQRSSSWSGATSPADAASSLDACPAPDLVSHMFDLQDSCGIATNGGRSVGDNPELVSLLSGVGQVSRQLCKRVGADWDKL